MAKKTIAANPIEDIKNDAEKLYAIRKVISEHEDDMRKLKEQRDLIQQGLLILMKETGILSTKVSSGDSITIVKKKGIAVTNELFAHQWCVKNHVVKPDLVHAAQVIKELKDVPPGFELVESEYISVRAAKTKE